jgi:hypothetical protein
VLPAGFGATWLSIPNGVRHNDFAPTIPDRSTIFRLDMNPEEIPIRDLHLPETIAWWPVAPGWWILLGLLLCGFGFLAWRALQKYRLHAPRRRALSQLRLLESEYVRNNDAISLGLRLSELLRRAMLAYARRDEVAGLTGLRWLEWLDRGLPEAVFSDGPGGNIESLPYRRPGLDTSDIDVDGLLEAVRQRLTTPIPESV